MSGRALYIARASRPRGSALVRAPLRRRLPQSAAAVRLLGRLAGRGGSGSGTGAHGRSALVCAPLPSAAPDLLPLAFACAGVASLGRCGSLRVRPASSALLLLPLLCRAPVCPSVCPSVRVRLCGGGGRRSGAEPARPLSAPPPAPVLHKQRNSASSLARLRPAAAETAALPASRRDTHAQTHGRAQVPVNESQKSMKLQSRRKG